MQNWVWGSVERGSRCGVRARVWRVEGSCRCITGGWGWSMVQGVRQSVYREGGAWGGVGPHRSHPSDPSTLLYFHVNGDQVQGYHDTDQHPP